MEPNYFFFLILPLAILVFFLVGLVIYNSKKEEDEYAREIKKLRQLLFSGKLDKKTYINLTSRIKYEKNFDDESQKLLSLFSDEKIGESTYIRLRKVLETTFRERLDKLDELTNSNSDRRPFEASKF